VVRWPPAKRTSTASPPGPPPRRLTVDRPSYQTCSTRRAADCVCCTTSQPLRQLKSLPAPACRRGLPSHARVVIVGGGIAGCSTAYHLTKLGITDVLLLEQGRLTSGTTWHAAGLVGQMRPNRNMTRMSRYGIELYSTLEAETGLATGWKQCGSVNVARTPERMQVLKKQAALARSFGVEVHLISPARPASATR
jgi:NADPH-dependent 2,4-dienoyl-CoA reductase/sulfur reductase-like enzyme